MRSPCIPSFGSKPLGDLIRAEDDGVADGEEDDNLTDGDTDNVDRELAGAVSLCVEEGVGLRNVKG